MVTADWPSSALRVAMNGATPELKRPFNVSLSVARQVALTSAEFSTAYDKSASIAPTTCQRSLR